MRMENALENRDTVGVADAVLLDDPDNTEEFIENLRKRFRTDIIYVSGSAKICMCFFIRASGLGENTP